MCLRIENMIEAENMLLHRKPEQRKQRCSKSEGC